MTDSPVFKLVAGHIALDFANTLDNRFDAERQLELLAEYEDFVRFALQAGVISATEAVRLRALPKREQDTALRTVRMVRELIEGIFSAAARRERVGAEDLAAFEHYVLKALMRRRLLQQRDAFRWSWRELGSKALAPLWPITLAAADLLTSPDLERVRECGAESCRWLFLDLSKNHSRRWCEMKVCGNRNKARRYYKSHS